MGITISSKRYSCDMGCGGFGRFRNVVAEKTNDKFYKHYMRLSDSDVIFLNGEERIKFFEKYDADTIKHIEENEVSEEIADFLFKSDCQGKIDRKQSKQIYELIKECDDNLVFGYIGRRDCSKMADMKKIFSDKTKVEWR